ncbi:PP-loop family-domain-containing protein [Lentinula aff. lateritia]|uniref:PP-loop family-domain-containing protein n=1 Tax=Lentinula aff. lateritia TaxID=2804960 RepID=A0ACC1UFA7_9AGAR|nr:PP-loop family-domain-containing protein [Lentinula aff. lateritia]
MIVRERFCNCCMTLLARPISRDEFIRAFRLCKPLIPWPETIAIGNSGGPDSTGLLFLMHRYFSENLHVSNLPRRVVSLHVDHGLQVASGDMAKRCANNAKSIGVEHHVLKVPWSKDGFPKLPTEGPLEHSARLARYRVLFDGMTKANASILALGHHADDQVETSLMRIMKGSTEDGAAGMKHCRRWGMNFGYFGAGGPMDYEGMRRWIIRPLLTFPKDRLLATCEENKLSYVTDETNFQPELTLRNALRQWLANDGKQSESDEHLLNISILRKKLAALDIDIDPSGGVGQIRSAVNALSLQADDIDHEVDFMLSRNALRSPPGTYLITHRSLASIENPKVQRAIILRILRYASFHPWGSLAAQVNRRTNSLSQIVNKLWGGNPFEEQIRPFCAGGGVSWTPVAISGDKFRFIDRGSNGNINFRNSETFGWLASRQNPPSHETMSGRGFTNPLRIDITSRIILKLDSRDTAPLEVLYDNRFIVTMNLASMPSDIEKSIRNPANQIWLLSQTRWFWPKVVLKSQNQEDIILHSSAQSPKTLVLFHNLNPSEVEQWKQIYWRPFGKEIVAPWIEVDFMRPLTTM